MTPIDQSSAVITRKSKSNLAFAFSCLPAAKRRDMVSFYAFCRVIDDIADDIVLTRDQKSEGLAHWRRGIEGGFANPEPLENEIVKLREKYGFPKEYLLEIIEGVTMDLDVSRYETFEELKKYCYRVACVVGLVSVEVFGYRNAASRNYAVDLGYALQMTNIMRDVWQDFDTSNRIYLPLDDMRECGYGEEDLRGLVYDERFVRLMRMQCRRAESFYARAMAGLPAEDRRAMLAAEVMRRVYAGILEKMKRDSFRVFEKRYRLSQPRKLAILAGAWARGLVGK